MDLDLGFVRFHDIGRLASWIGALISATATGATLWFRRRDRPEADFHLEQAMLALGPQGRQLIQRSFGSDRDHDECLTVINVGDGTAYNIVVTSQSSRVRPLLKDREDKRGFRNPVVVPRLAPGDDFMLVIWYDEGVAREDVVFRVEWLNSPTRHKRQMANEIRRRQVLTTYPGESRYD
jgi:hypothetical protein